MMSTAEFSPPPEVEALPVGGYLTYVTASFGHALMLTLRRRRLVLAAGVSLLPVLIPLAMVFLSTSQFQEDGAEIFVRMVERLHINMLAPLLGLFFAVMLVAEDVEGQTLPYVLTRPIPRSAWVVGRFLAFYCVALSILAISLVLTFSGSTALSGIGFTLTDFKLLAHYSGIAALGLMGYGAISVFLGILTRRPIVVGVLIFYGWQKLAMMVPGLIDFLTIQKYTDALLPRLATQRHNVEVQTVLGSFEREVFMISAGKAAILLLLITAFFLGLSILTVRRKEYASARAMGA